MRSIGDAMTVALAAVGICCGAPLLLGAIGASTLGLGLAGTGLATAGVVLAAVGLVLLAIRRTGRSRDHVR